MRRIDNQKRVEHPKNRRNNHSKITINNKILVAQE